MKQQSLARWLKVITIVTALMGVFLYVFVLPEIVRQYGAAFPEFRFLVLPSQICIWVSAVPCYIALYQFWMICLRIGQDNSFCAENAASLSLIGKLAIGDTILCLAVTVLLYVNHAINPGVLLTVIFILFAGVSTALVSMTLAHLVTKACKMKEENDFTI